MRKVLVEIFVPASNHRYNVFIPEFSKMSEIVLLVSNALSELSNGKFKADASSVLCDADSGQIYNINASVRELQIKNGSRLMLI